MSNICKLSKVSIPKQGTKFASVLKLYVKDLYNSNPPLNQYLSTDRFIESKLLVYIKDLNCKRFRVK